MPQGSPHCQPKLRSGKCFKVSKTVQMEALAESRHLQLRPERTSGTGPIVFWRSPLEKHDLEQAFRVPAHMQWTVQPGSKKESFMRKFRKGGNTVTGVLCGHVGFCTARTLRNRSNKTKLLTTLYPAGPYKTPTRTYRTPRSRIKHLCQQVSGASLGTRCVWH